MCDQVSDTVHNTIPPEKEEGKRERGLPYDTTYCTTEKIVVFQKNGWLV